MVVDFFCRLTNYKMRMLRRKENFENVLKNWLEKLRRKRYLKNKTSKIRKTYERE